MGWPLFWASSCSSSSWRCPQGSRAVEKIQSCEKFFNQVPISIGFPVRGYFCLGHVISGLLSQFQYISMRFFLMEVAWKTDQRFFKLARLWPSGPSFMG